MTFKNQQVLVNCSWEVKKGERVGLVGVNGAGAEEIRMGEYVFEWDIGQRYPLS